MVWYLVSVPLVEWEGRKLSGMSYVFQYWDYVLGVHGCYPVTDREHVFFWIIELPDSRPITYYQHPSNAPQPISYHITVVDNQTPQHPPPTLLTALPHHPSPVSKSPAPSTISRTQLLSPQLLHKPDPNTLPTPSCTA
jgi:hypothetical protein